MQTRPIPRRCRRECGVESRPRKIYFIWDDAERGPAPFASPGKAHRQQRCCNRSLLSVPLEGSTFVLFLHPVGRYPRGLGIHRFGDDPLRWTTTVGWFCWVQLIRLKRPSLFGPEEINRNGRLEFGINVIVTYTLFSERLNSSLFFISFSKI